jgi:hypothetical protein
MDYRYLSSIFRRPLSVVSIGYYPTAILPEHALEPRVPDALPQAYHLSVVCATSPAWPPRVKRCAAASCVTLKTV